MGIVVKVNSGLYMFIARMDFQIMSMSCSEFKGVI